MMGWGGVYNDKKLFLFNIFNLNMILIDSLILKRGKLDYEPLVLSY